MAICSKCQSEFSIRDQDREFYKQFDVPDPLMCSNCRLQHRLCFRNERTYYRRESSFLNQTIVSIYDKDAKFPVYSQEEWWSDKWDGLDFGQEFDFNRTFFEQFEELLSKVPRIALFNVNPTNSEYCQQAYDNKNSYLCNVVEECEDCMYVTHSNKLTDSFDCSYLQHCELCYDCIDSEKLYACIGCQSCQNSSNLSFCYDCVGCQNCVGCFGLRNKKYYIMNEEFTREEYEKKIAHLEFDKFSKFKNGRDYFLQWTKNLPHRASRNFNCEASIGNYLINCQRCHECFSSYELQDCAYCTWIFNSHDVMDVYGMGHSEWVLECLGVERVNTCAFNTFVSHSSDTFYSDLCFNSHNLFGCVGLRSKTFCILNKEYKEAEYKELKGKIIEHMKSTGEWGKFFPVSLSPYAYNETAAMDYFPLSKKEVLANGFKWKEPDAKEYLPQNYQMADDVKKIGEAICNETLACSDCGKNYKILSNELKFYHRMSLPVPRKCPDCRYKDRLKLRNPRALYARNCDRCAKGIKTSYSCKCNEKIFCEVCYTESLS